MVKFPPTTAEVMVRTLRSEITHPLNVQIIPRFCMPEQLEGPSGVGLGMDVKAEGGEVKEAEEGLIEGEGSIEGAENRIEGEGLCEGGGI